jgi:hypothetical protein
MHKVKKKIKDNAAETEDFNLVNLEEVSEELTIDEQVIFHVRKEDKINEESIIDVLELIEDPYISENIVETIKSTNEVENLSENMTISKIEKSSDEVKPLIEIWNLDINERDSLNHGSGVIINAGLLQSFDKETIKS